MKKNLPEISDWNFYSLDAPISLGKGGGVRYVGDLGLNTLQNDTGRSSHTPQTRRLFKFVFQEGKYSFIQAEASVIDKNRMDKFFPACLIIFTWNF